MRRDHVISRLENGHRANQYRRHSAGSGHAGLRPLKRREPVLEDSDRWVCESRVNVPLLHTAKPGRRLCRIFKHITRGEEQRLGVLVELAACYPSPYRERFPIEVFRHDEP